MEDCVTIRIPIACSVLCLALLTLGVAFYPCYAAARSEITEPSKQDALQASLSARLAAAHCLFHEVLKYTIVVETVEGTKLIGLMIMRKYDGEIEKVTQGREGELRVDPGCKTLSIRVRYAHEFDHDGNRTYFEDRTLQIPLK